MLLSPRRARGRQGGPRPFSVAAALGPGEISGRSEPPAKCPHPAGGPLLLLCVPAPGPRTDGRGGRCMPTEAREAEGARSPEASRAARGSQMAKVPAQSSRMWGVPRIQSPGLCRCLCANAARGAAVGPRSAGPRAPTCDAPPSSAPPPSRAPRVPAAPLPDPRRTWGASKTGLAEACPCPTPQGHRGHLPAPSLRGGTCRARGLRASPRSGGPLTGRPPSLTPRKRPGRAGARPAPNRPPALRSGCWRCHVAGGLQSQQGGGREVTPGAHDTASGHTTRHVQPLPSEWLTPALSGESKAVATTRPDVLTWSVGPGLAPGLRRPPAHLLAPLRPPVLPCGFSAAVTHGCKQVFLFLTGTLVQTEGTLGTSGWAPATGARLRSRVGAGATGDPAARDGFPGHMAGTWACREGGGNSASGTAGHSAFKSKSNVKALSQHPVFLKR